MDTYIVQCSARNRQSWEIEEWAVEIEADEEDLALRGAYIHNCENHPGQEWNRHFAYIPGAGYGYLCGERVEVVDGEPVIPARKVKGLILPSFEIPVEEPETVTA